jgi:hypothetical protein
MLFELILAHKIVCGGHCNLQRTGCRATWMYLVSRCPRNNRTRTSLLCTGKRAVDGALPWSLNVAYPMLHYVALGWSCELGISHELKTPSNCLLYVYAIRSVHEYMRGYWNRFYSTGTKKTQMLTRVSSFSPVGEKLHFCAHIFTVVDSLWNGWHYGTMCV